jgi:hypothetical protein
MQKITIQVDVKWLLTLGGVALLLVLFSFRPSPGPPDSTTQGRFQAVSSERGVIILDTQTGDFVMEQTTLGRPTWLKGDFKDAFEGGKSLRK